MPNTDDFLTVDGKLHCYACGTDWPLEQKWERSCGECGHIWPTLDDLVGHDHRWTVRFYPAAPPRAAEDIIVCPCCTHDL